MVRVRRLAVVIGGGLLALGATRCSSFGGDSPVVVSPEATVPDVNETHPEAGAVDSDRPVADAGVDAGPDTGATTPCTANPECERIVFVTSTTYDGAGVASVLNADKLCNQRAKASTLLRVVSATFVAWISDSVLNGHVGFRFVKGSGRYVSTTGVAIANNWTELTSGTLRAGITHDEKGLPLSTGEDTVWTATTQGGDYNSPDCTDWKANASVTGRYGTSGATDAGWTSSTSGACGTPRHLYCFEK